MRVYQILSRLLDYPDPELMAHLDELADLAACEPHLDGGEARALREFLAWLAAGSLIEAQKLYVQTFDLTPDHSLHLTHHLFGDDKGRGPALVELGEHYKGGGFAVRPGELPDYLPLVLEYAATLDEAQARFFLADAAKVTGPLAERLEQAQSPWAPLLRMVASHGSLTRQAA